MSSCLGVLLELKIPDLLAKEDKPIALQDVGYYCASWLSPSLIGICFAFQCFACQNADLLDLCM